MNLNVPGIVLPVVPVETFEHDSGRTAAPHVITPTAASNTFEVDFDDGPVQQVTLTDGVEDIIPTCVNMPAVGVASVLILVINGTAGPAADLSWDLSGAGEAADWRSWSADLGDLGDLEDGTTALMRLTSFGAANTDVWCDIALQVART